MVAIVTILVVGCTSSTSGTQSGGTLVVGELFALTGRIAFSGGWYTHGAQVAIADINKAGGVMGSQLKAVSADTASDPADAVTAWRQLQLSHPVVEIGPTTVEIGATEKLYEQAQLVDWMMGGAISLDRDPYQYVWRTIPSDTAIEGAVAYFALTVKKCTTASMIFDNTADSFTALGPLTVDYTINGGTILDSESIVPHQSSYLTEVSKAFASKPSCVFFHADPQTAAGLFANIKELGYLNIPFIGDNSSTSLDFLKAVGLDTASKYLTGMVGAAPAGPSYTHFINEYQQVLGTNKPDTFTSNLYDALVVSALAMTDAKSTTPAVWVNKLNDVTTNESAQECTDYASCVSLLNSGKKIDYEGASGSLDFNQFHNVQSDWSAVSYDPTGNPNSIATITAAQAASYS